MASMLTTKLHSCARVALVTATKAIRQPSSISQLSLKPLHTTGIRTFSVSSLRLGKGLGDKDLIQKLSEELTFEKENSPEEQPEFLKDFNAAKTFKIVDKTGEQQVVLKRQFGNEEIQVFFGIDSMSEEHDDFKHLDDMEENEQTETEDDEIPRSFPVTTTILITKPSSSALEITATAQDGTFFIDNVSVIPSQTLAKEESAEADWKRRGLYSGPAFQDLDEGLQDAFHRYLEERGFDSALAEFIPNYVEFKEQKEYMTWLAQVKSFVQD